MTDQPRLTEEEWALVVQLLQREQDELPVEIHHCRVTSYRDDLHYRLETVKGLLERIRAPIPISG